MAYLDETMPGAYLFGDSVSVADLYLFVMLLWARKNELQAPGKLGDYRDRIAQLPSARAAMQHEGLI